MSKLFYRLQLTSLSLLYGGVAFAQDDFPGGGGAPPPDATECPAGDVCFPNDPVSLILVIVIPVVVWVVLALILGSSFEKSAQGIPGSSPKSHRLFGWGLGTLIGFLVYLAVLFGISGGIPNAHYMLVIGLGVAAFIFFGVTFAKKK